ncbi:hypothetical protein HQ590_07875 [bacterium]|nr:hypothetical protein [bacterium]
MGTATWNAAADWTVDALQLGSGDTLVKGFQESDSFDGGSWGDEGKSDQFNDESLDEMWTTDDGGASGQSFTESDDNLNIATGTSGGVWWTTFDPPRIYQSVAGDFQAETHMVLAAGLNDNNERCGLFAEWSAGTWFGIMRRGSVITCSTNDGAQDPGSVKYETASSATDIYFRIWRKGSYWRASYSTDAESWTECGAGGSGVSENGAVNVGVAATETDGSGGYSAKFDYLTIDEPGGARYDSGKWALSTGIDYSVHWNVGYMTFQNASGCRIGQQYAGDFFVEMHIADAPDTGKGIYIQAYPTAGPTEYCQLHFVESSGLKIRRRDNLGPGGNNTDIDATGFTEVWLRMQRVDSTFSTWYSTNGTDWTSVSAPSPEYTSSAAMDLSIYCTTTAAMRVTYWDVTGGGSYSADQYVAVLDEADAAAPGAAWDMSTLAWSESGTWQGRYKADDASAGGTFSAWMALATLQSESAPSGQYFNMEVRNPATEAAATLDDISLDYSAGGVAAGAFALTSPTPFTEPWR